MDKSVQFKTVNNEYLFISARWKLSYSHDSSKDQKTKMLVNTMTPDFD